MNPRKILSIALLLCVLLVGTAFAKSQPKAVSINGDHGKLVGLLQTPKGKTSYPLVIIMHGFNSQKNENILVHMANALEKNGIASLRFDFNGHGDSEGDFAAMTVYNEINDARNVFLYAKGLPGVTSVSLAGHSQGGVVAAFLAAKLGEEEVKSLTLLAPAGTLPDSCRQGDMLGVKFDPQNPPAQLNVFGRNVGREYLKTMMNLPLYEKAADYHGPVFIAHGTADTTIPVSAAKRFQEIYPGSTLKLINKANHGLNPSAAGAAAKFVAQQTKKA